MFSGHHIISNKDVHKSKVHFNNSYLLVTHQFGIAVLVKYLPVRVYSFIGQCKKAVFQYIIVSIVSHFILGYIFIELYTICWLRIHLVSMEPFLIRLTAWFNIYQEKMV